MPDRPMPLNPHPFADRWNHNPTTTHGSPRRSRDARVVLDVGCGDGTFARYLSLPGRRVIGLERRPVADAPEPDGVDYVQAPRRRFRFADGSVDAVPMIMVLHHVDPESAGRVPAGAGARWAALLGYGRSRTPFDLFVTAATSSSSCTPNPCAAGTRPFAWPTPTLTWADNRRLLESELPGGRYRRLPMWRFEYRGVPRFDVRPLNPRTFPSSSWLTRRRDRASGRVVPLELDNAPPSGTDAQK